MVNEPEETWEIEGRGEQVSLPRRSGEVQQSGSPPREQVQEELLITEAVALEPTVTTFKPAEEAEVTTTMGLIIREEIGETTVAMEQVRNDQLADMLATFVI